MDPKTVLIPGIILSFFSLSQLLGKLFLILKILIIRFNGIKTLGIVKEVFFEDEETAAANIEVHYHANDGKTYSLKSESGSVFNRKLKGMEIEVFYHTQKPEKAFIVKDIKLSLYVILPIYLSLFSVGLYLVWESLGRM
ncbi:MAG: hypothetical protein JXR36_05375 [Bacteroidales bacterium]|nr:hypothetical protein [Bacteroidales bacterium]